VRRLLVLVASFNEEEGIGPTLAELTQVLENPAVLIVDGNSTDRTIEVAEESGAEILIQRGKGKGDAIAQAIPHINGEVEYVILTDADFTYPAEYLPRMMRVLDENPHVGMVCGNRFNSHFSWESMHSVLYLGNRVISFVHNFLNGVQMGDPLTGLRVVRWEILKGWTPKSKGFDIEVELNHLVERRGYRIVEVPIVYRPRLGEKKLKPKHAFEILTRIVAETLY
jgi:glycosyltransferase involved in cell wall biosynthesis